MSARETLHAYAGHSVTGEPIPEDLLRRLLAARNFNQGFATVEYTAAALLDLEFHTHPAPETIDPGTFEREIMTAIGMPAEIGVRHRPTHFQHLLARRGYAAGHYGHLLGAVLHA